LDIRSTYVNATYKFSDESKNDECKMLKDEFDLKMVQQLKV